MAHPILSAAVERALATFDQIESETGPLQNQAMQRLWAKIDAVRDDLRLTLESVGSIQHEQARLRQLDEDYLREPFCGAALEGVGAAVKLLRLLGTSAFTDDALCKLAALHADQQHAPDP